MVLVGRIYFIELGNSVILNGPASSMQAKLTRVIKNDLVSDETFASAGRTAHSQATRHCLCPTEGHSKVPSHSR